MLRKLRFFTVIAMLSVVLGMRATSTVATPCDDVSTDTLRVSLITCAPGPEVYQLFGHSAMRVQRSGVDGFDLVFNYGVFSFSDDFILKFTQGHTDYMLAVYDFQYFLIDYVMRGSTVYEQELNLTHASLMRCVSMPVPRIGYIATTSCMTTVPRVRAIEWSRPCRSWAST